MNDTRAKVSAALMADIARLLYGEVE